MKLITKVVAAAGAIAMAMIAAPTAQAATGWDRCTDGYFCIFEHANGQGKYAMFKEGASDLGSPKVFNGYMNDKTSSVWNRDTGKTNSRYNWWCMYRDKLSGGTQWLVAGRDQANNKINLGAGVNDNVSSLRPQLWIKPPGQRSGYWTC